MIGKTTTRPPENRYFNLPESFHHIISDPPRIGDRGVLTNPKTLVNTSPQMFSEMPVNIPVNPAFFAIRIDN
jgi:hypothetical protein